MNMRFSEEDRDRVQLDWQKWWNHELDRPLVVIERLEAMIRTGADPDVVSTCRSALRCS